MELIIRENINRSTTGIWITSGLDGVGDMTGDVEGFERCSSINHSMGRLFAILTQIYILIQCCNISV